MESTTGFEVFMNLLLGGFKWESDGCLIQWAVLVFMLISLFIRFRKINELSKQTFKLSLITCIWGVVYGLTLVGAAAGSPTMPSEMVARMVFSGLSAVISPFIIVVLGWLILTLMDMLIKEKKA